MSAEFKHILEKSMEQNAQNFRVPDSLRQSLLSIPYEQGKKGVASYMHLIAASFLLVAGFAFYMNQGSTELDFVESLVNPAAIVLTAIDY